MGIIVENKVHDEQVSVLYKLTYIWTIPMHQCAPWILVKNEHMKDEIPKMVLALHTRQLFMNEQLWLDNKWISNTIHDQGVGMESVLQQLWVPGMINHTCLMEQTETSIIHCNLHSTGEVANRILWVEYGILMNSTILRTFTFWAIQQYLHGVLMSSVWSRIH